MSARALLAPGVLLAALALGAGPVHASDALDRRAVALPPGYPAPPPGFVPLPSSGAPLILVAPGTRADAAPAGSARVPAWRPSRTEVVIGLDGRGRVVQILEYVPGRFRQ